MRLKPWVVRPNRSASTRMRATWCASCAGRPSPWKARLPRSSSSASVSGAMVSARVFIINPLQFGLAHDVTPALAFRLDERGELPAVERRGRAAVRLQVLLHRRHLQRLRGSFVDPCEHGRGRFRRGQEPEPLRAVEAGVAQLRHRGHVGQGGQTLRRAAGDDADAPRLRLLDESGRPGGGGIGVAGDQVRELRAGALVRHVHHVDSGRHLQHLEGEMAGAAVAGGAVTELARVRLGQCDEFGEILRRHLGTHREDHRHLGQQADRLEVLVGIRQLVEHRGVHGQRADVAEDDRVAVRRGPRNLLHRDGPRAAALVVDEDRLAERLAHFRGQQAGDHVGAAARAVGHHEADRALRLPHRRLPRGRPGARAARPSAASSARRPERREKECSGEAVGRVMSRVTLFWGLAQAQRDGGSGRFTGKVQRSDGLLRRAA